MCCANGRRDSSHPDGCCIGGRMSRFIEPSILLLLSGKPSHGYELMEELEKIGLHDGSPDPGAVYRNLRRMEEDGLLESEWDTSGTGPARRLYRLTPKGQEYLEAWAVTIEQRKRSLEKFLKMYAEFSKERKGGADNV